MTSSPSAPRAGTILTVTLNLALDVTYVADGVDWDGVNRVRTVHRRAGGKGVNVARVLAALGHDVLVTGLAGGAVGHAVRADLTAAALPAALTPITGESRTTLAVTDHAPLPRTPPVPAAASPGGGAERAALRPRRRTALFNEPGPVVSAGELDRFAGDFEVRLRRGGIAAVVISGSMPRGVPAGFYASLARRARDHGIPVIVDADGEALRHAPAGRPAIVKPNAEELTRALTPAAHPPPRTAPAPAPAEDPSRTGPPGLREALLGAETLRAAGAGAVVVSLGADGLLAVTPEGAWRAAMPYRVEGNPTGAGDALVAGLALGLVEGIPWPERLRRAAALGAAAVAAPVAGDIDRDVFRAIAPGIRIEPVRPQPVHDR
ncbi:sugar kinase [Planobispora rosea]|uniref:Sugar kinase n=1 Tax=Planobispora rosea TaxID=35762 RepID=A0A8J3S6M6_PLARO|nr:PfkB family carbohydrate kinase [Planobispora rosea]GGS81047.1 sugar kinase [Planobispora rosea]GIH85929.1 sugar kinase [Planobispora rosea]